MAEKELKIEWIDKYTDSLASHLRFYKDAADRLGVDRELIIIHDLSKSFDDEFPWYVRRFGGGIKDDPEWPVAWNHHIHNNPHHWEYWITPGGNEEKDLVLEMPDNYALEMIADWMGSGRAYTGGWDMTEWLKGNLSRIKLHSKTRKFVEKVLVSTLGYGKNDIAVWSLSPLKK